MLIHEGGYYKSCDGTGEEGEVGVDEGSVLLVPFDGTAIKTRPVQPEEYCTYKRKTCEKQLLNTLAADRIHTLYYYVIQ